MRLVVLCRFTRNIHGSTVSYQRRVPGPAGRRRRVGSGSNLSFLASARAQFCKVPLGHLRLVLATEHADFEICNLAVGRGFRAGSLEVVKVLIDDVIGVDVTSDLLAGLLIRDKFCGRSKIDSVLRLNSCISKPARWWLIKGLDEIKHTICG